MTVFFQGGSAAGRGAANRKMTGGIATSLPLLAMTIFIQGGSPASAGVQLAMTVGVELCPARRVGPADALTQERGM